MTDNLMFYRQTALTRVGFHWTAADGCWTKDRARVSDDRLETMSEQDFARLMWRYGPRQD